MAVPLRTPGEAESVVELISRTPIFKKALQEKNAAVALCRQTEIREIRRLEREIEAAYPKLEAAVAAAMRALKAAEAAYLAAQRQANEAIGAKSTASHRYTAARDRLERALRETAAPQIVEFIREMGIELDNTRRLFAFAESTVVANQVTGRRGRQVVNNAASVAARVAAIMAAIASAEDLRVFQADQAQVPELLAKLRAELPAVDPTLRAPGG